MSIVSLRAHGRFLTAVIFGGTALACADRDAPRPERSSRRPTGAASAGGDAPIATKSTEDDDARRPTDPHVDTGASAVPAAGAGEFHLDDPEVDYDPMRRPTAGRKARALELVLRSTPPGAVAAVDGVTVGPTPALWEGSGDGRAREFTFVLPGYAIARYRFVPTQSGVVHGTLGRLKAQPDAGPVEPAP